ncbi:hypothetical protein HUG10_21460 (plasmid) [Halorarum halophilum]|uniref:Uncharacterized protein n=1 Tax=Halorarum halophilum TaxID=2743090 RepID=A0A7D5KYM0_9EURY|nr:hypothetical protein [Halobaculum halophilum]QLG30158.1 hypothetical protein HUG10_21460 [Halobaculum halophilum]
MGSVEFGEVESVNDAADKQPDDTVDHVPDNMAPHFAGAYKKGALARRAGESKTANPYDARYNPNSCMGGEWGHVWSNAWRLGYKNESRKEDGDRLIGYNKAWKMGR